MTETNQQSEFNIRHLEKSALRGEPSHVWRFGQDRRLDMILKALPVDARRILVDGCGLAV